MSQSVHSGHIIEEKEFQLAEIILTSLLVLARLGQDAEMVGQSGQKERGGRHSLLAVNTDQRLLGISQSLTVTVTVTVIVSLPSPA